MIDRIHESGWNEIQSYLRMKFGEVEVVCPYYTHSLWKPFTGVRVLSGKGFAREIVEEANIFAMKERKELREMSPDEIRRFLSNHSLGIECSGFISHVLYAIHGKKFFRSLTDDSFGAKLLRLIRPFQQINVQLLQKSGKKISFSDARPEDIIVTRGGKHALIVIESERDDSGKLKRIEYAQSTLYYNQSGVRLGTIQVSDPIKPWEGQDWLEIEDGVNFTHQGYLENIEQNGVYRLPFD